MDDLRSRAALPAQDDRTVLDAFPCLRCAKTQGKLNWLSQFPDNPWAIAMNTPAIPVAAEVA